MKTIYTLALLMAVSPLLAAAQVLNDGTGGEIGNFSVTILGFIQEVIIPFILSIGFLVFVWGMFQYFIRGGANDEAKESGKSLIMYAVAGFVMILAFWGIVNILSNGIGLAGQQDEITPPNVVPRPGN
jgi:hypothetical protein